MSCHDCRHLRREEPWPLFDLYFCQVTGALVGYECPLGAVELPGCGAQEAGSRWPEGAIA